MAALSTAANFLMFVVAANGTAFGDAGIHEMPPAPFPYHPPINYCLEMSISAPPTPGYT